MFGHDNFFRTIERDFFGRSLLDELHNDPFFGIPFGTSQRSARQQHVPHQRVTNIEVLDDNDHSMDQGTSGSSRQPIVEEPDENTTPGLNQSRSTRHYSSLRSATPTSRSPFDLFSSLNNSSSGTYVSYSSSSFGGPNGQFYSSTTTSTMGPGGVRETQHSVKDSRTGTEKVAVSRTLGGKSYTVEKSRNLNGNEREETVRKLDNLNPDEVESFDREWQAAAERNLPRVDFSRFGIGHHSANRHPQIADRRPHPLSIGQSASSNRNQAAVVPPLALNRGNSTYSPISTPPSSAGSRGHKRSLSTSAASRAYNQRPTSTGGAKPGTPFPSMRQ